MNCIEFIKQLGTQVKMMHMIFICIFHMTLEQKCVYLSNEAYYTAFTCEHIGTTQLKQEMCASQNMPICINRVFPLPQGNHAAKFGQDPIYRTKVIVRKRSCCQKFYL